MEEKWAPRKEAEGQSREEKFGAVAAESLQRGGLKKEILFSG